MVRKTLRIAKFGRDAVMAERPEGVGVAEATPRESIPPFAPAKKSPPCEGFFYFPESCPTFPSKYRLVV